MTSLYPGTIFNTSGLNKKSTPSKPNVTKDQLSAQFRRQSYNHGRAWPKESPVAGVYDVTNTTTSLIIINSRQRRGNKLRGHNDPDREGDRIPNPDRHSRFGTPVTKEFHVNCHNSQSPYFSPTVSVDLEWANYTQRPPAKFYDGSPVNPKRHTSCRVPSDPIAFQSGMVSDLQRRPYSHISLPSRIKATPLLEHPELNEGEKQYLANIARIYSANQMMKLKQDQYNKLLLNEMSKGMYNKDEIDQYRKFINKGRRRQYMSPPTVFRTASAPPPRTDYSYDEDSDEKINSNAASQSARSSVSDKSSSSNNKQQQGQRPKSNLVKNRSKSPAVKSFRSKSPVLKSKSPGMRSKSPGVKSKPQVSVSEWQPQTGTQNKRKVGKNQDTSDSSSETSSSEKYLPSNSISLHKEGQDRPKSRLGHLSPRDRNKTKDKPDSSEQEKETTSTPQKAPPPSPVNIPSAQNTSESKKLDQEPNDNTASSVAYRSSNSDEKKDRDLDETFGENSKSTKENETKNEKSVNKDESPMSDTAHKDSSISDNKPDNKEDNIVSRSNEGSSRSDNKTDNKEDNVVSRSNEDSSRSDNKTGSKEDNTLSNSNEDSSRSNNKTDGEEGNTLIKSNDDNASVTSEDFTHTSQTKTYTTSFEENTTSQKNTDNSATDNYTSSFPTYTGSSSAEKSTTQPLSHSTDPSSTENPTSVTKEDSKTEATERQTSNDQLQRQDSLEEIDMDNPRHVNKDIDAIEY